MSEYLFPLFFLVVMFTGFGLANRDRRSRGCHGCENECDESGCENS